LLNDVETSIDVILEMCVASIYMLCDSAEQVLNRGGAVQADCRLLLGPGILILTLALALVLVLIAVGRGCRRGVVLAAALVTLGISWFGRRLDDIMVRWGRSVNVDVVVLSLSRYGYDPAALASIQRRDNAKSCGLFPR
jgi:hypothetical protein